MNKKSSKKSTSALNDTFDMTCQYGLTHLVLITRDPHCLYAYWEIAEDTVTDIQQTVGSAFTSSVLTLRIYDVTFINFSGNNANHYFDIDVGTEAHDWYINLRADNVSYVGEIGWRLTDGTFMAAARSNHVTTQRAHPTGGMQTTWMNVSDVQAKPQGVITTGNCDHAGFIGVPSDFLEKPFEPKGIKSAPIKFDKDVQPSTKRKPLSAEEVRAYYARLSPLLKKVRARRSKKNIDLNPRFLESILAEDIARNQVLGRHYPQRVKFIGASKGWEFEKEQERERAIPLGASDLYQNPPGDKEFYFELGTELIAYGRTEAGAKVYYEGTLLPLRDDGTFTLRFSLPSDKHIPLDFKAVSDTKQRQRRISTSVRRFHTKYS